MKVSVIKNITIAQDPIFVVGYPRSGTTLLQAMLATQDNIYSFPETHFFSIVSKWIRLSPSGIIDPVCLDDVFRVVSEKTDVEFTDWAAKELKEMAEDSGITVKSLFELIVFQYLRNRVTHSDIQNVRWLEKTPAHALHLNQIAYLYPLAKFVHILRNPIPAIVSGLTKRDPSSVLQSVTWYAHMWNAYIESCEQFRRQNPQKIHFVRYEDLTRNPEKSIREILVFLNIEPKLSLVRNYWQMSPGLILAQETWKEGVSRRQVVNTNATHKGQISMIDIVRIQHIVRLNMWRHRYHLSLHPLQIAYDFVVFLRDSMSILKDGIYRRWS